MVTNFLTVQMAQSLERFLLTNIESVLNFATVDVRKSSIFSRFLILSCLDWEVHQLQLKGINSEFPSFTVCLFASVKSVNSNISSIRNFFAV